MNGIERAYAAQLEARRRPGEVLAYYFERVTLRLADRTFYRPDFLVVTPDCIEIHEVKGFWEDDARVKWKVAAEQNPWARFLAVRADRRRGWVVEEYGRGGGA